MPDSIGVPVLAIDSSSPLTLYAATRVGVYKSTDGANSWNLSSAGMSNVSSLAINPTLPNIVYGLASEGLFKSVDGGTNWNRIDTLPSSFVGAVAIDDAKGI